MTVPRLETYLLTFNCARTLIDPTTFAPHLFDALPSHAPLPDLIAISLQEVAPIAYSFLGGSYLDPYFDRVHTVVELAARKRGGQPDTYRHVLTENLGMTALMLFAKPNIAERTVWMQTASTGVGLWEMGNKGAVGARLAIASDSSEEPTVITFIAAHLAPMEDGVERRNQDWENIVRTLVFKDTSQRSTRDGEEHEPLLATSVAAAEHPQYTTLYIPQSYTFLAGDLNYRTRDTPPGPKDHQSYPQPTDPSTSPKHYTHLLQADQLTRELRARRTLHGFREQPITFPPTYKYSFKRLATPAGADGSHEDAASTWAWAKHRVPSWCDRILYLAPPPAPPLQPHAYTSLPLQPTSDHQPVVLAVSIPLVPPVPATGDDDDSTPFAMVVDRDWKARYVAARRREKVVGVLAWLALTKEGNAALLVLGGGMAAAWWLLVAGHGGG